MVLQLNSLWMNKSYFLFCSLCLLDNILFRNFVCTGELKIALNLFTTWLISLHWCKYWLTGLFLRNHRLISFDINSCRQSEAKIFALCCLLSFLWNCYIPTRLIEMLLIFCLHWNQYRCVGCYCCKPVESFAEQKTINNNIAKNSLESINSTFHYGLLMD